MKEPVQAQITLNDVRGFIRRRKKAFITAFVLVFLLACVVAVVLPPIYRSKATILIEEQQIPDEYVKSTLTSYAEERLESITQQIMSYTRLIEIIKEYDLYTDMVADGQIGKAVMKMRDSIELETISSTVPNPRTGRSSTATVAFTLAFEGAEPKAVQKVTNALAELYLAEDLKAREKQVAVTTTFLEEELERLKKQIQDHEQRISVFKAGHIGELPENSATNLQTVARLEREVEQINSRIRTLQDRKIILEGQLAGVEPLIPVRTAEGELSQNPSERLKRLRLELLSMQSRLSDRHPDIKKLKSEIKKLEAQTGSSRAAVDKVKLLREKEGQLASLKSKLGDKHPDVKKLAREVDILSHEVANLGATASSVQVSEAQPDNPVYINLITQITAADSEMANSRIELQQLLVELETYRRKIERAPLIEKEYQELTLDYSNARSKYNEILDKLLEAQVARGMEERQQGERFLITERAFEPQKPYKPNRIAIVLLGTIVAVVVSVGLVAVQEGLDTNIRSEDDLFRLTGVPVLSSISVVVGESDRKQNRRRLVMWMSGSLVALAVCLMAINLFVIPLSDLIDIVLSRIAL
jgi:uncharacterized protein involved in exopolysaccharide biosynthesis